MQHFSGRVGANSLLNGLILSIVRRVIDTEAKLATFLPRLNAASWIAIDTEADSLHAYPEKLCLIQVSIDAADHLLDPLAGLNLQPAFDIFSQHQLVLHGADYDLRLFRKHCGFVPTSIFDTMFASRLLGAREFGLGNLVDRYLGVKLEKGPQKANWARRPLTPRMEVYARNDTRFLKPIADILAAELKSKGRLEWHRQCCARLIADSTQLNPPDPESVWRVKGSHQLAPPELAVLRALWHWREAEAVTSNRPPYFILPPEVMVGIAIAAAGGRDVDEAMPRYLTARRRDGIRDVVGEGLADKHPPGPLRHRGKRLSEGEKRRLHQLEDRRNQRASELELDPTLIAPRALLIALAGDWEEYEKELMPWQRELLS
ncbi:MAG: ribonuclease [Verrucomicrobiota bacterium]|jgi:ribonuclease D